MARPAPHALTENRVEDRADRQRQALVEREQRQRQGDDGVDRPGVQTPVEDGRSHAQTHGFFCVAGSAAKRRPVGTHAILTDSDTTHRRAVVRHGLGHAVEHQADAHTGGEQHGEPAHVGVVGRRVLAAEAYLAQWRQDQPDTEDDENVGGADEEPGHVVGEPVAQATEQRLDLVLQSQGEDHEDHRDQRGDGEDLAMDVEGENELPFDVVLTDDVIGVDQIGLTGRCRDALVGFRCGWRGRVMRRDVSHTWRAP